MEDAVSYAAAWQAEEGGAVGPRSEAGPATEPVVPGGSLTLTLSQTLARLADMGIGADEALPFCDGVTDVETLVGLIMEARDRSVGIPGTGLPAVGVAGLAREEEDGGRGSGSTATVSKACAIL